MAHKLIKKVIITGAGFSAPANLPIQNRIFDMMLKDPKDEGEYSFLEDRIPAESIKFLHAYIIVGLYILKNYGTNQYGDIDKNYKDLCEFQNIKKYFPDLSLQSDNNVIIRLIDSWDEDENYAILLSIRENVRQALIKESISISLEDVFTLFDKAIIDKEYVHDCTYNEIDNVQYAITCLFIYYFSKCVDNHDYKTTDYLDFFNYIKKSRAKTPITILTTNWDTLIEEYCNRLNITYNYGFNSKFTPLDYQNGDNKAKINLFKVHGSINWLKCRHCGGLSVFSGIEASKSLFDDNQSERCMMCNKINAGGTHILQPEIITPTMVKELNDVAYLNIWSNAGQKLKEATHVVFLGYSFPSADFEFRYMLQKSIPPDALIDVVLTNSSNPKGYDNKIKNLLPEKRYRDAFPKNTIHFFYNGFGDYFR